jgi:hypothetical protein
MSESLQGGTRDRLAEFAGLLRRLCQAESIGRIYSVNHPKAKAAIRAAFDALSPLVEEAGALPVNFAETKVLIAGVAIEDRNPVLVRFISAFQQIQVDSLLFMRGLSYEEFEEFFRPLLQGAKVIAASGGLQAMLEGAGVTHVQAQQANYVLVRKEDAQVAAVVPSVETKPAPSALEDEQLIRYMARQILTKSDKPDWLIDEITKDPGQMADFITEGIELASTRSDSHLTSDQTIFGLLDNLRLIGKSLSASQPGSAEDESVLQEAILALEAEVHSRSKKLASQETAAGFVKDVLSVITLYADEVRARRISQELQKPKRDINTVARHFHKLVPENITSVACLQGIHDLLLRQGVTEDKFQKLTEAVETAPARKPRARKLVLDTISAKLEEGGVTDERNTQLTTKIGEYFDRELNARTASLKEDNRKLMDEVRDLNRVLDQMDLSVICWNSYGLLTFVHHSAVNMLGLVAGCSLSAVAHDCLKTLDFPLTTPDATLAAYRGLNERDAILLRAVEKVIVLPNGKRIAALLRRA